MRHQESVAFLVDANLFNIRDIYAHFGMCVFGVRTLYVAVSDLVGHVHAVLQLILGQRFARQALARNQMMKSQCEERGTQTFLLLHPQKGGNPTNRTLIGADDF